MTRKERFEHILEYFRENKPDAETELVYSSPYELLVAVMLSAQCTDKRVNKITLAFFELFSDVFALAGAEVDQILEVIKSCSYPNTKAKNLRGMADKLIEEFDGVVPRDTNQLQKLPGVGRKTANVIASVVYNDPAMAVDTHVFRVSARIGLTVNAKTPYQAELQLVKYIPSEDIHKAHHWLILHGRYICTARKPKCSECPISHLCKYFKKISDKKSPNAKKHLLSLRNIKK